MNYFFISSAGAKLAIFLLCASKIPTIFCADAFKIPIILALGNKEVENQTVTVRRLGEKNTEILSLTEIINSLKTLTLPPDLR